MINQQAMFLYPWGLCLTVGQMKGTVAFRHALMSSRIDPHGTVRLLSHPQDLFSQWLVSSAPATEQLTWCWLNTSSPVDGKLHTGTVPIVLRSAEMVRRFCRIGKIFSEVSLVQVTLESGSLWEKIHAV